MASRKRDPASLRTLGLWTGQTPLEEAAQMMAEEDAFNRQQQAPREANDMIPDAYKSAVIWLGEETVERGDDIRVAVNPKSGAAVLVLIRGDAPAFPYSTVNLRLSAKQWKKLQRIASGRSTEPAERPVDPGPPFPEVDELPFPD